MTRSDVELLSQIAGGDVATVGLLYDRHAATLFPIALRIVRDRTEAEDVLHDAFVAVSERASQYTPERGAVIAWLVTLVRNLAIDRTRRRERRGSIARDVLSHEPPVSVRDPERLTSEASERAKIHRALASLPEAQRQTLEVAFFEGLSYPEIAARENVPLGTIKSRAARALAALRDALDREGVALDAFVARADKPGSAG
jgi:RNA polymerase sigma-70 factor (ECF subfamily)